MTTRVCFVCLGNICRSPTAEGVFKHLVREANRTDDFAIESAGTAAYHEGEAPDRRSTAAARERGFELIGQARGFIASDFDRFDHVVAMDRSNLSDLTALARTAADRDKLSLLRAFDPQSTTPADADVPDPYYGGGRGFENVLDICVRSCSAMLERW